MPKAVVASSSLVKRSALGWLGCVALLACEQPPKQVVRASGTAPPMASVFTTSASAAAPSVVAPAAAATSAAVAQAAPSAPPTAPAPAPAAEPASLCNEQTPQAFLVNAHFDSFNATGGTAREWKQILDKAVRYRTEQYGYVKGFGKEAWNASTPTDQARVVTFFGVEVSLHRRIAPALACVETAIRAQCADHPYQPYVL